MAAIATIADIKTYAGLSGNASDSVLQMILDGSLPAIESYCDRKFQSQAYNEFRDGNNSRRMTLIGYPVTAFTSLTIDGASVPASVNGSNGYFVSGRSLILVGYTFCRGFRNVQITYVAGYGDASGLAGADLQPWPKDLKNALLMYCLTRFNERTRFGVGSMSMAGQSITFDAGSGTSSSSGGIPAAAKAILNNYSNTVPESGQ